ncbi:MAG: PP2C family protein-serine/threonine phosphatase, partial [Chloroflexota bacterium]
AFAYAEISRLTPNDNEKRFQIKAVNAGGMSPMVRRADGQVEWLEVSGLPLGVIRGDNTLYQTVTANLSTGDMIILTSDGVVEAQNLQRQMWGFDRFEAAVMAGPDDNAQVMLNHLRTEIEDFLDTDPHDDITIVVIQV